MAGYGALDIWIWALVAFFSLSFTYVVLRGEQKPKPLKRVSRRVLDDVPYDWEIKGL